jgi:hypothetical protein
MEGSIRVLFHFTVELEKLHRVVASVRALMHQLMKQLRPILESCLLILDRKPDVLACLPTNGSIGAARQPVYYDGKLGDNFREEERFEAGRDSKYPSADFIRVRKLQCIVRPA